MTRLGYLGPAGTFAQMALLTLPEAASAECLGYPSVDTALDAVRKGEIDAAMVPIENSVEGGVPATLDSLAVGDRLSVVGEVLLPIRFALCARPGTAMTDIRAVSTHGHAWAQVRRWMREHLPDAVYVPALSTAAGAQDLAQTPTGLPFEAAVCAPVAAAHYGLPVLAGDLGDNRAAVTRFFLVAPPGSMPDPTGADKTTLVLYQRDDRPGGLLELLEQFAARGVNLTRLESRPTGERIGQYCFSVDLEGHAAEDRVAETLMGLHRVCAKVRFLGSYPRADGHFGTPPVDHDADQYSRARAWLTRVLYAPPA